jgi:hypothetical protein
MMAAWDDATEIWRNQAEASSRGHATEYAEYKAAHPMPNVGDFMKGDF